MARKKREGIDRVIADLSRDGIEIRCGCINPDHLRDCLRWACEYLSEYQDAKDAAEVAGKDVAEVGAIIRRQRERIAFLTEENRMERKRADRLDYENGRLVTQLEKMGAA